MPDNSLPDTSLYDLLDRAVADLPEADRTLLGAMRGWVHAMTMGGDPAEAAARALPGRDAAAAFDRAMRTLDRGSTDQLVFQRPCHTHVDDAEAMLLAIWRQLGRGEHSTARATLRLLVGGPGAGVVAAAMAQASDLLVSIPAARR